MEWRIDRNSKMPMYKQIMEIIEQKITNGEYPPGSLLPPERKLGELLNVNRMTIVRVYDELAATGLIIRKQGSGTRVNTHKWGILPSGATNWKKYIEGGTFLPMLPLIKRIKKESASQRIRFDLTSLELPDDLFPAHLWFHFLQDIEKETILFNKSDNHMQGQFALRETIAQYMKEFYHINTSSSSILVTTGTHQSLHLITQCLLSPGDAIALESPSYLYSLPLFQSAGLRVFDLPVDENGMDPEGIIDLHRKHRIKFIFTNPIFQNPTGTVLSESRRKRVAEIAAELNIPICEGDPYNPLAFAEHIHHPIKGYDEKGNALFIGSLEKTISLNLGIGWIIGPHSVIERLADARQQMDVDVSVFSQLIANKILQSAAYRNHLTNLRVQLQERRDQMVSSLSEVLQDKIDFHIPQGGFYIWCKIKKNIKDEKLVEEGIKNNILIMPGSALGAPDGYVRLTYAGLKKEEIQEAVSRFAQCIDRL